MKGLIFSFAVFIAGLSEAQLRDTLPPVPSWIELCDISKNGDGTWQGTSKRRNWFITEGLMYAVRKNGVKAYEYYTDVNGIPFSKKVFLVGRVLPRSVDTTIEQEVIIDANFIEL